MKKMLVDSNGKVLTGLISTPVDEVNYKEYPFQLLSGYQVPEFLRPFFVNQFIFLGISGNDLFIGLAVIDLKYAANAFVYVYDQKNRQLIEEKKLALSKDVFISSQPDRCRSFFHTRGFTVDTDNGHFSVKTSQITLDVSIDLKNSMPLRLCTRAGYNGWVYTQKTTPIELSGSLSINGQMLSIKSPNYMALVDWTTGYMRRETFWNWAAITTVLSDGRNFGMNLSCGVNETSFTENAFVIDNVMTKVDMVHFDYDPKNLFTPWMIRSNDQRISLRFEPDTHRSENINAWIVTSRFTQLMGRFSGHVQTDDGEMIYINNCPGWAEDHFARW
ncbi:MAG: DUF2804 domain-containing protein [Candidatus Magnetomorum sp.]|nr:DUF2804 domain-containing protein [Candidatus Magnetomorum sp.]